MLKRQYNLRARWWKIALLTGPASSSTALSPPAPPFVASGIIDYLSILRPVLESMLRSPFLKQGMQFWWHKNYKVTTLQNIKK
jgi:hypothetical protein